MSKLLAEQTGIAWLDVLINAVYTFIGPILILAATAGIIYAIVVGVKFIKADDKSQRDEAKAKLISVIVGIVVTIVLIALFYLLANNIYAILETARGVSDTSTEEPATGAIGAFVQLTRFIR